MANQNCTIGCFQEQTIAGYPCEDLVQWPGFVEQQLDILADLTGKLRNLNTIFTVGVTIASGGHLYNCVAVIYQGVILGIVPKEKLPTYDVFYEARTFSPGLPGQNEILKINGQLIPFGDLIFRAPFGTFGLEICEDLWSADGPMRRRAYSGAELIINASASPWRHGVVETRREMIATRAGDNQVTIVYVNQFGGQDSLVFDGGGFICQNGRMLIEAPRWQASQQITTQEVDLDLTANSRQRNTTWRTDARTFASSNQSVKTIDISQAAPTIRGPQPLNNKYWGPAKAGNKSCFLPPVEQPAPKSALEYYFDELTEAMRTGLSGYYEKTGAFQRLGISLSGGRDSILTLIQAYLFAKDYFYRLGYSEETQAERIKDFIRCYSQASRHNSEETQKISRLICRELGVTLVEYPIDEAYERELAAIQAMLGPGATISPVTKQNIQARIRASRMWNISNSAGLLWLQTGNMSEKAVGYTTVGGDLMGCYSLLGNLPKTVIIALTDYLGEKLGLQSTRLLARTRSSAELADNQCDEDDLMPFPILDACFSLFAGDKLMPHEIYLKLRNMYTDNQLKVMSRDYVPGLLKQWVKRFATLFLNSIFKWVQAPQAVHLGSLDLDRERALQLPVVQSKEWLRLDLLDALPD